VCAVVTEKVPEATNSRLFGVGENDELSEEVHAANGTCAAAVHGQPANHQARHMFD
jgi:hypothetical protein